MLNRIDAVQECDARNSEQRWKARKKKLSEEKRKKEMDREKEKSSKYFKLFEKIISEINLNKQISDN